VRDAAGQPADGFHLHRLPKLLVTGTKGLFGLAIHLTILAGGILAPEYFLFPLGLAYMLFGILRAVVLGLMEEPEPVVIADERLADENNPKSPPPPLSREPRGAWSASEEESNP
jgi:hypothetical protein